MKKSTLFIKSIAHLLVTAIIVISNKYLDLIASGATLTVIRYIALGFAIIFLCIGLKFLLKFITICFGTKEKVNCIEIKDRLPSHMDDEHTPIIELFLTYQIGNHKTTDIIKKDTITSKIKPGDTINIRKLGFICCFDYSSFIKENR